MNRLNIKFKLFTTTRKTNQDETTQKPPNDQEFDKSSQIDRSFSSSLSASSEAVKEPNNNQVHNDKFKVCHICNRTFMNGKALGGHMRVHNISAIKSSPSPSPCPNMGSGLGLDDESGFRCNLCNRVFISKKAIYGHMKSHPDRAWRGMQPPRGFVGSGLDRVLSLEVSEERLSKLFHWGLKRPRGHRACSAASSWSSVGGGEERDRKMRKYDEDEMYFLRNMGLVSMDYDDNYHNNVDKKWKCNICKKCFMSHQALGVHQLSHNGSESSGVGFGLMDLIGSGSGSMDDHDKKCDMTFELGSQVDVGGGEYGNDASSSSSSSSPVQTLSGGCSGRRSGDVFEFDLNVAPLMDDDGSI